MDSFNELLAKKIKCCFDLEPTCGRRACAKPSLATDDVDLVDEEHLEKKLMVKAMVMVITITMFL